MNKILPKVIYQTYFDKTLIPQKVYINMDTYANEFVHKIYDDDECIEFLKQNYSKEILDTFMTLSEGAFKADLFRYCILYKYGGVYLDIKTELIKPIRLIFTENYLYSAISKVPGTIYQGILATPPNNHIFENLIEHMVVWKHKQQHKYLRFTRHFYNELAHLCNGVKLGLSTQTLTGDNVYLFKECISHSAKDCYDGLDKFGCCSYIYDKNEPIIKTRYADYPWN